MIAPDRKPLRESAPWIEHCNELKAFFAADEDVTVGNCEETEDEGTYAVKVYVRGTDKAKELDRNLRHTVIFGAIVLNVIVVPDNEDGPTVEESFARAFAGNPIFCGTVSEEMYGGTITYVVFEPEVLQYWNDNIGSIYGIETKTVEEVAKDVLDTEAIDVLICSDMKAE